MKNHLVVDTIILLIILLICSSCTTPKIDTNEIILPEKTEVIYTINDALGKNITYYHILTESIEYLCIQGDCPIPPEEYIKEALKPCNFCSDSKINGSLLTINEADKDKEEFLAGCIIKQSNHKKEMEIIYNKHGILKASGIEKTTISQKGGTCNSFEYIIQKHVIYTFSIDLIY